MAYILDADSLIKLNFAEGLEVAAANRECVIPGAVYEEAVIRARRLGKPDADAIDAVILRYVEVVQVRTLDPSVIERPIGFGDDQVFTMGKRRWLMDLIVTDDRRLANRVVREIGRLFGPPIDFFPMLAALGLITIPQARGFIVKLRPRTPSRYYQRAVSAMEALQHG